jgi:hypothetical protein
MAWARHAVCVSALNVLIWMFMSGFMFNTITIRQILLQFPIFIVSLVATLDLYFLNLLHTLITLVH